jgi:NADPH-dependent 2,4-dienoyl-CoA reductase/sulfur reductase-like enzyme
MTSWCWPRERPSPPSRWRASPRPHGFYTLADAKRLREALVAFGGGRVLIVVAATPYRSLAAPYEAAFLIEELLRRRGALWLLQGGEKPEAPVAEPNSAC